MSEESIPKFFLTKKFKYTYEDSYVIDMKCEVNKKQIINRNDIDKDKLKDLAKHYVKRFCSNDMMLMFNIKIDNIRCLTKFLLFSNEACCFISKTTDYCSKRQRLLNIVMSNISKMSKENILFNLLFHANYILTNTKYDRFFNILYFNEEDLEHNLKIAKYHNELFNEGNDEFDCPVCLNGTITKTPCNHFLCSICYEKLNEKICPICRKCLIHVYCNTEDDESDEEYHEDDEVSAVTTIADVEEMVNID